MWGIKLDDKKKQGYKADYSQLKTKLFFELAAMVVGAIAIIAALYKLVWSNRGAEWTVSVLRRLLWMDREQALRLYGKIFRGNMELIWMAAIFAVFLALLRILLNWFTRYFDIVSRGIDALLTEQEEIQLPSEMLAVERRLNAVKQALEQRTAEAKQAEQRKNDLVMYLAHDIRTPLTMIKGYAEMIKDISGEDPQARNEHLDIKL